MAEKEKNSINKKAWYFGLGGLILGALIVFFIRFATYHVNSVHYHANFAVYINGQREQFKEAFYYQEVGKGCTVHDELTPHERVHMHDNINSVVHVHDNAVTWGNFFQNIGWAVDQRFITTPFKVFNADDSNKVRFILNGQRVDGVNNLVIGDQDRLLVDYGNRPDTTLQSEYKSVPKTAHQYDISKDPASCGGGAPTTSRDRITHLF